jgi:hypothetical protein
MLNLSEVKKVEREANGLYYLAPRAKKRDASCLSSQRLLERGGQKKYMQNFEE